MEKYLVYLCAGLCLLINTSLFANQNGYQIFQKSVALHELPYEYERSQMTLIDANNHRQERVIRRYIAKTNDGSYKYLLVFDSPAGVKGVSLLTWQNSNGQDDQWLYLPAQSQQLTRIAKGSQKNYFMGTDFAFEDLMPQDKDHFDYKLLSSEKVDGLDYYVVEVTPKNKQYLNQTNYKARRLFIRGDNYFISRIDFFDKNGTLFKRQLASELVKVQGNAWRAKKILMKNYKTNHATLLEQEKSNYTQASVPEKLFTHRYILSGELS